MFLDTLKRSAAAGVMIGLGAAVYLSCANAVVGAVFFSVGLFMICSFSMYLFTGKIGYIIDNRNHPNCLLIWSGNLLGCLVAMGLLRLARPDLCARAAALMEPKLARSYGQSLLLALFCGILMYLAVENYRANPHGFGKILGLVFCVATFILSGFEHSIADMCYAALAVSSAGEALSSLLFLLVVTVGNSLGALAVRFLTTRYCSA